MPNEFPFERAAMNNEDMPYGLDIADACFYTALRIIYKAYHNGVIDRKTGVELKNQLSRAYISDKSEVELLERSALSLNERIKRASEAYKANRTIENADELYNAFYNL
nr:MAG TPA: hypothetical protein [Caudoviricetes sp.]